jgi:hypothetical protein
VRAHSRVYAKHKREPGHTVGSQGPRLCVRRVSGRDLACAVLDEQRREPWPPPRPQRRCHGRHAVQPLHRRPRPGPPCSRLCRRPQRPHGPTHSSKRYSQTHVSAGGGVARSERGRRWHCGSFLWRRRLRPLWWPLTSTRHVFMSLRMHARPPRCVCGCLSLCERCRRAHIAQCACVRSLSLCVTRGVGGIAFGHVPFVPAGAGPAAAPARAYLYRRAGRSRCGCLCRRDPVRPRS